MPRLVRPASLAFLFLAAAAFGQVPPGTLPIPRVTSVFPMGAKAGSAVDVLVNGSELTEAKSLLFSHPGLTAEKVTPPEPKPDPKTKAPAKKVPTPNAVSFRVTVGEGVPPGLYDLRVVSPLGVSNPRFFCVGTVPEVNESEPNNDVPEARVVPLNATVNGVISSPTDVDYVRFQATAKTRVFAHAAAGSIESKARPLVELYSTAGSLIARNRNERGTDAILDVTIPADGEYVVRVCEFAYQYGGPDHFYRLTLTTEPSVDAVFPPVVPAGQTSNVTLFGRGVSGELASLTAPASADTLTGRLKFDPVLGLQDGFEFRHSGVPVFFARTPVALESKRPNDTAKTAQEVFMPCELCGRIDVKNDADWYSFPGKKDVPLAIDLAAERIGGPSDVYFTVHDAKTGRELAGENQLDDDPEILHPIGFFSRTSDPPTYRFVPPADGGYLVRVAARDANVTFGPKAIYRLRIAPPRPDFRAIVMPRGREYASSVVCRPGTDTAVEVYVHRTDFFTGPVTVTATDLPPGVTAEPTVVGTNQKWGTLILKTKPAARTLVGFAGYVPRTKPVSVDFTGRFDIRATAEIEGKTVTHVARPATITWGVQPGQNNPAASRLDQSLPIAVRDAFAVPAFSLTSELDKATKRVSGKEQPAQGPFVLKPGERLTVPFIVNYAAKDRPAVTLNVEPTHNDNTRSPLSGNNANVSATIPKEKSSATLTFEMRPNAQQGVYHFVIRADATANVTRPADKRVVANVVQSAFVAVDVRVEK
jgi:hypothetical protein